MKYAKWIFVVLLISSLTSFVEKDKPTGGLNVGDMAPDFKIQTMSAEQSQTELSDLKGKYVLLSFLGKLRRAVPDAKRKFEQCASLYCPQQCEDGFSFIR